MIGDPEATDHASFKRLIRHLSPTKKDVFFDLGCGYGNLCIWIANRVRFAFGFETNLRRYHRALKRVEKSGQENIRILRRNYERLPFEDATIIYCTNELGWGTYARIQRDSKVGTIVVLGYRRSYLPRYPIKAKRFDNFWMIRLPFSRYQNEKEYARAYFGRKSATIEAVYRDISSRNEKKTLKWDISHSEYNWKETLGIRNN
jgi:SAM-dependent methyltransferase